MRVEGRIHINKQERQRDKGRHKAFKLLFLSHTSLSSNQTNNCGNLGKSFNG